MYLNTYIYTINTGKKGFKVTYTHTHRPYEGKTKIIGKKKTHKFCSIHKGYRCYIQKRQFYACQIMALYTINVIHYYLIFIPFIYCIAIQYCKMRVATRIPDQNFFFIQFE